MLHNKLHGYHSAVGPRIPSAMQILILGYLEYVKLSLRQGGMVV